MITELFYEWSSSVGTSTNHAEYQVKKLFDSRDFISLDDSGDFISLDENRNGRDSCIVSCC